MQNEIHALNVSAKKVHGADIFIMVARAISFGHDDNLIIVQGRKHERAAADLVKAFAAVGKKPKVTTEKSSGFMGIPPSEYTTVQFA